MGTMLQFRPEGIMHRAARLLLVVAHPDDESMFFAPLLTAAARSGTNVFVLCLSNGTHRMHAA